MRRVCTRGCGGSRRGLLTRFIGAVYWRAASLRRGGCDALSRDRVGCCGRELRGEWVERRDEGYEAIGRASRCRGSDRGRIYERVAGIEIGRGAR